MKHHDTSEESLIQEITQRIRETLQPVKFTLHSETGLHKGHKGNQGGSHFKITVVSEVFEGLKRVDRERWVTGALGDLMGKRIHALSMVLKSPREDSKDFVG